MATIIPKAHVLLVEDDESLRQMYSLILQKAGYKVTLANDGVEGLAKARAGGFDLILLDLMMPNMDGLGFLRGLAEEPPRKPNGPVVVLSNAGYEKIAEEAAKLGARGFLMKADLLPDDLVAAVEKHLVASQRKAKS
jgi:two-component system chemotaxis response regulator CheY